MERLSPTKKCTLILLVFLSQIFRYPITPSPTATDNFFYITIAKSILDSGQMFWAHESLSLYGLYPGTTPMGSIIVASALTEVTNLSVHDYQLVHSFLFSLVATLSFFMLSGEFSKDYRTRWFSSLCFSLAPLFLSLTLWRLSLRFSFISFLPLFIWSLLRISNKKYGRNPTRLFLVSIILLLVLPSLHRISLFIPVILLAFFASYLFFIWQESAINRERAGRQVSFLIICIAFYLLYLQFIGHSIYNPDIELIQVYFFSGSSIFYYIFNLMIYYFQTVGPFIFLSLLGVFSMFQQGRISISHIFSLLYLSFLCYIISDVVYVAYIATFGILLLVIPGVDLIINHLSNEPKKAISSLILFIFLLLSFSNLYIEERIEQKENDELNYSHYIRESSMSSSFWLDENIESAIIESNDGKRARRISAYSDMIASEDSLALSNGIINFDEMEVERKSLIELYHNFSSSDYLWEWTNRESFNSRVNQNMSLSVVNLAMPEQSGKSSTLSIVLDYYYKNMPDFNYRIYANTELGLYWTKGY